MKFRRQHAIGPYVVDFYCEEARLAVELDDGGHDEQRQERKDAGRDVFLAARGVRVLRFWNSDVARNLDGVLWTILEAVEEGLRGQES